jgi:PAS domain S-box-containing protein
MPSVAQSEPALLEKRGLLAANAPSDPARPAREEAEGHLRSARLRLMVAIPAATVVWVLAAGVLGLEILRQVEAGLRPSALDLPMILLVTGLLIVAGLAALTGLALARNVLEPVSRLARQVEAVAQGKPAERIQVSQNNEIGDLGAKFNTMVSSLQSLTRERSEVIMEQFAGSLVMTDHQGIVTALNSEAAHVLGVEQIAAVGRPFTALLGGEARNPGIVRDFRRLLESGEEIDRPKMALTTLSAGERSMAVSGSVQRDRRGELRGAVINLRDLDRIRDFHERMKRSEQLTAISTFASGVAHEIRNPLASIRGIAQLVAARDDADERWHRHMAVIESEAVRLEKIMAGLDAFTQESLSHRIPCDLSALVPGALALARDRLGIAPGDELPVTRALCPVAPVLGDPDQLLQAFFHVILNALEATREGGEVWIRMATVGEREVVVEIENSGSSIDPEAHDLIFTPFYTTKEHGPGLGLAVARQIVAQHQGSIDLTCGDESVLFRISLPCESSEAAEVELSDALRRGVQI